MVTFSKVIRINSFVLELFFFFYLGATVLEWLSSCLRGKASGVRFWVSQDICIMVSPVSKSQHDWKMKRRKILKQHNWPIHRSDGIMKWFITSQIYNKIAFSLFLSSLYPIFRAPSSKYRIERKEIERKGNFVIDLRCYKLFHCIVGPMTHLFFSIKLNRM